MKSEAGMLHFITGPSGCGKTTIMRLLRRNYGWRTIRTFTTRPARPDDDKVTVTADEFARRALEGQFFTTKQLFGEMYGEDRSAFLQATAPGSTDRWCLDLAWSEIERYEKYRSLKVILLPETREQLREQLSEARRTLRIAGIDDELRRYQLLAKNSIGRNDYITLVNRPGQQSQTARQIKEASERFDCDGKAMPDVRAKSA